MEFKDRFKELRLKSQLTQALLSDHLNVNDRTIRRYESGEIQPTAPAIIKIAKYFEVSVDYLLGLTDNPEIKR